MLVHLGAIAPVHAVLETHFANSRPRDGSNHLGDVPEPTVGGFSMLQAIWRLVRSAQMLVVSEYS